MESFASNMHELPKPKPPKKAAMKDPRDDSKYTKAFTMVFEGDIRKFKQNPLTTETPWGVPYAVAMGDALEELDKLRIV